MECAGRGRGAGGGGGVPVVGQSGCDPGVARPAVTGRVLPNGSQLDVHVWPVREPKWEGEGRGGSGRRLLALQKTLHAPPPAFTTAFFFIYKKNRWQNEQRTEHASFTRRTKRNKSIIYTVLCTDMIPNNFVFFFFSFFSEMHLWKIWSVFFCESTRRLECREVGVAE